MFKKKRLHLLISWIASIILLQTLYFKFTGHEQSVKLFTILGMEPWGRIGTGILELIAVILILYRRTTGFGALLGLGLMSGAIFFHLTKLGISFDGDPGFVLLRFNNMDMLPYFDMVASYRNFVFPSL